MFATLQVALSQMEVFFLVFARVAALLMSIPVYDGQGVPALVKVSLILALSLALFPVVGPALAPGPASTAGLVLGLGGELLLGAAIGLSVRLLLAGVQMAGQMAGYQMGIAIADIMDPATSAQIPILAQFYNILSMLLFLTLDIHHWFFRALAESFRRLPPLSAAYHPAVTEHVMAMAGQMFLVALQVAAPVIVVLVLSAVAFGLVARTVPQMNVFFVAIPLKLVIGLLFAGFSLPFLGIYLGSLFGRMATTLAVMLRAWGG